VNGAGVGPAAPESAFTSGAGFRLGPFATPSPTVTMDGGNVTIAWPDPVLSAPMTYALSAGTVSGQADIGTFLGGAARQFSDRPPARVWHESQRDPAGGHLLRACLRRGRPTGVSHASNETVIVVP
jgi:hypothetical protein